MAVQEQAKRATSGSPTVDREHRRLLAVFVKESARADLELGLERRVWGFSARGRAYVPLRPGDWAIFGWGVPEPQPGVADGGWQGLALGGAQICRITTEAYTEPAALWPSELEGDESFLFRIGIEPIQRLESLSLSPGGGLSEAAVDGLRRSGLDRERTGYVVEDDDSAIFDGIEVPDLFGIAARAMSDAPAEADSLGYAPLVEGLDTLLNDKRTLLPLSIAITAPWGRGKSSVMLQLQKRLRRRRGPPSRLERASMPRKMPRLGRWSARSWEVIRFDAWKYERSERLWAALAKAVYDQPQEKWSPPRRWVFRLRLEAARQGWLKVLSKVVVPVLLAIGAVAVSLSTGVASEDAATKLFTLVGGGTFAGTVSRYWGFLSDPFKRAIDSYANEPDYSEQLGFTARANADIQALTKVLTKREGRCLAIFVDDLDRCAPTSVVEIVEAINQIFNPEQGTESVFVLGMDVELVAASIEVAYKDTIERLAETESPAARDFGRRFLAKVVQISVTLPPAKRGTLGKLLEEVLVKRPTQPDAGKLMRANIRRSFAMMGIDSRSVKNMYASLMSFGDRLTGGTLKRVFEEAEEREAADGAGGPIGPQNQVTPDSPSIVHAEHAALEHLEPNPREVKRFDNAFRLQVYVANRTPDVKLDFGEQQLTALAKWMVLRIRWPKLAEAVDEDLGLLETLEHNALLPEGAGSDGRGWVDDPEILKLVREPAEEHRLSKLPLEGVLRVA